VKQFLMLALLLSWPAWCAVHNLVITGQTEALTVQAGDTVNFVGDSNQVSLSGDCANLSLTGSGNHLRIDGQMNSLQVVGSDNQITWVERGGRHAPALQSLGSNNQLVAIKP